MTNLGVRVEMRFSKNSIFGPQVQTLHNVTEIHYNFYDGNTGPNGTIPSKHEVNFESRIAFESDVHGTGVGYQISDIAEFETFPETTKARSF